MKKYLLILITLSLTVTVGHGQINNLPVKSDTIQFIGTVKSIFLFEKRIKEKTIIASNDPHWVMTVNINSKDCPMPFVKDTILSLAIHSPVKLFAKEKESIIGQIYNFQITRTQATEDELLFNTWWYRILKAIPIEK